jgi:hypothetical protein
MNARKRAGNHGRYAEMTRLHGGMFARRTFAVIFIGDDNGMTPADFVKASNGCHSRVSTG